MERATHTNALSTPSSRASATQRSQDMAIAAAAMRPGHSLEEVADKACSLLAMRTIVLDDPIDWLIWSALLDITALDKRWSTTRRVP